MRKFLVFLRRVLLLTVVLALGLEGLARLLIDRPASLVMEDPVLHHKWRPNLSYTNHDFAGRDPRFPEPYQHSFNSQSWLSTREFSHQKSEGVTRIIYLGDSFTEGTVEMSGSVPSLVKQALNEALCAEGEKCIEVINTGTTSYSPVIYASLLRNLVFDHQPDLIVLNIDMTDVFDDWKYWPGVERDGADEIIAVRPNSTESEYVETQSGLRRRTALTSLYSLAFEHSDLVYLSAVIGNTLRYRAETSETIEELHRKKFLTRFSWPRDPENDFVRKQAEKSYQVIQEILALCQRRGVSVFVTTVPHAEQLDFSDQSATWSGIPHAAIRVIAEENGALWIDSFAWLRASAKGKERNDLYYPNDMHFNPEGYKLWAEVHITALRQYLEGRAPAHDPVK